MSFFVPTYSVILDKDVALKVAKSEKESKANTI